MMDTIEWLCKKETFFGTALQLYVDTIPVLVLGLEDDPHSVVLEKVLNKGNIPYTPISLERRYTGPPPFTDRYELVGAGLFNCIEKRITLLSNSQTYQRWPNRTHADRWNDKNFDWTLHIKDR